VLTFAKLSSCATAALPALPEAAAIVTITVVVPVVVPVVVAITITITIMITIMVAARHGVEFRIDQFNLLDHNIPS
jgi:hypothetical protein